MKKRNIEMVEMSKSVLVRVSAIINVVLYCGLLAGAFFFFYRAHSPYGSGHIFVYYFTVIMIGTAIAGITLNLALIRYYAIAYYLSMLGWAIEAIVLAVYLYFTGMSTWTPWGWYDYAWTVPAILVVYKLISIIYFRTKPVRTSFNIN